jgi:hypothetical protein
MSAVVFNSRPLSIPRILEMRELDGKFVAVHGILYSGEGCRGDEFLCLPKDGGFDGITPGRLPVRRAASLCVREPTLATKFENLPSFCGPYAYQFDAIVMGRFRRGEWDGCAGAMEDLLMVVLHEIAQPSIHYDLGVHVISFSRQRVLADGVTKTSLEENVGPGFRVTIHED